MGLRQTPRFCIFHWLPGDVRANLRRKAFRIVRLCSGLYPLLLASTRWQHVPLCCQPFIRPKNKISLYFSHACLCRFVISHSCALSLSGCEQTRSLNPLLSGSEVGHLLLSVLPLQVPSTQVHCTDTFSVLVSSVDAL